MVSPRTIAGETQSLIRAMTHEPPGTHLCRLPFVERVVNFSTRAVRSRYTRCVYKHYYNPTTCVCFIKHFGHFVGADATEAVMRLARISPMESRQSLKGILFDFRDVEQVTLTNSNSAHSKQLIARMDRVFPQFWDIRVARLLGPSRTVRQVFDERERRMNLNAKIKEGQHCTFEVEAEAFGHLGVPVDYRIPYPD